MVKHNKGGFLFTVVFVSVFTSKTGRRHHIRHSPSRFSSCRSSRVNDKIPVLEEGGQQRDPKRGRIAASRDKSVSLFSFLLTKSRQRRIK